MTDQIIVKRFQNVPGVGQVQLAAAESVGQDDVRTGLEKITVQAQNPAGISDPVTFVMGIEASGFVQPSNILELVIDVTTKVVSLASATGASSSAAGPPTSASPRSRTG